MSMVQLWLLMTVVVLAVIKNSGSNWFGGNENEKFHLNLRSQTKTSDGYFKVEEKKVSWEPQKTAFIICDMWDDHWCKSAADRVGELSGPMNEVIKIARAKGSLIIHAPSTVTSFYKNTPQRRKAQEAPFVLTPKSLSTSERWGTNWCWPDESREGALPIDDSDMGAIVRKNVK